MNKTQTTTFVISSATVFSVIETMFAWPAILGVLIGIIALVKGSVVGWGINNRKVALIVIIVSFVCFSIINYAFIFLYVLFI